MIVDTSALIAVLRAEPDASTYAEAIAGADELCMSAVNYVEASAVIDGSRDPIASRSFDDLIEYADIAITAVTVRHAHLARAAYRDFGKGSGHPAKLNLGDCFAYALAKETGEPLLFKGDDFRHTDVSPAAG